MKKIIIVVVAFALLVGGFFALNTYIYNEKQATVSTAYKDALYIIDGRRVQLTDGYAETEISPDSASKIVTRYFGNELHIDLNSDGREDVVFLLTQETGGSGVFYYAVGAVATDNGYIGSDGYLLGDRIAPQTTQASKNPRHKNVVVINYANRKPDEPMTVPPSIGTSTYLKLVPESMQWATVEPEFEGESVYGEINGEYVHPVEWPPKMIALTGPLTCSKVNEVLERVNQIEQRTIAGREYCIAVVDEGAAGSTYRQYAYLFAQNDQTLRALTFTVRLPQCMNYDEPSQSACLKEQKAFDPDLIIGSAVAQSNF